MMRTLAFRSSGRGRPSPNIFSRLKAVDNGTVVPFGLEARVEGRGRVGKAPHQRELASPLAKRRRFREDRSCELLLPWLCQTCDPPLWRVSRFQLVVFVL